MFPIAEYFPVSFRSAILLSLKEENDILTLYCYSLQGTTISHKLYLFLVFLALPNWADNMPFSVGSKN